MTTHDILASIYAILLHIYMCVYMCRHLHMSSVQSFILNRINLYKSTLMCFILSFKVANLLEISPVTSEQDLIIPVSEVGDAGRQWGCFDFTDFQRVYSSKGLNMFPNDFCALEYFISCYKDYPVLAVAVSKVEHSRNALFKQCIARADMIRI